MNTQPIFTQDSMLDKSRVLVKLTSRGKYSWCKIYVSNFTNYVLDSVVVTDDNNDLVEVPARWIKEVK